MSLHHETQQIPFASESMLCMLRLQTDLGVIEEGE
jgi:hypothetical protein